MKKFYTDVTTAPATDKDGWSVLLDGRSVKTPARHQLIMPTEQMASAVADEWRSQNDTIEPDTMPMMRLATTVIDLLPDRRGDAVEEVLGFLDTDMICYRVEMPARLVAHQESRWDPVVARCHELGAPAFSMTTGLAPIEQSTQCHQWMQEHVSKLDDWLVTALHSLTTVSGSVLLGVAATNVPGDVERWCTAATANEDYEMSEWGTEADAEKRRQATMDAITSACRFVSLR